MEVSVVAGSIELARGNFRLNLTSISLGLEISVPKMFARYIFTPVKLYNSSNRKTMRSYSLISEVSSARFQPTSSFESSGLKLIKNVITDFKN